MTVTIDGMVVHVLGLHPYDRYVGRQMNQFGLKADPLFANPFKVGKDGSLNEILAMYENYIRSYIAESPNGPLVETLGELRGLTLACWCAPRDRWLEVGDREVCHGQTLLRIAKELHEKRTDT